MELEVNKITLNYIITGYGKPLILLHGNGEDHSIFLPLIDKLKDNFTVYAIDSRNHGASSKTSDYSYATMTEDIYQFITKLDLTDVSIVGFSDGAIIATMLELAQPNTFSKMALLGINLSPSDFKQEYLDEIETEYRRTKDPLLKMMLEEPNIDLTSLQSIGIPTLVVRAEDELFQDELYDKMASSIPDAKLVVMQGHDHGSYVIGADVLYGELVRFL